MKLQVEKVRGQMVGRGGGGTDRRGKVQERETRKVKSGEGSQVRTGVTVLLLSVS